MANLGWPSLISIWLTRGIKFFGRRSILRYPEIPKLIISADNLASASCPPRRTSMTTPCGNSTKSSTPSPQALSKYYSRMRKIIVQICRFWLIGKEAKSRYKGLIQYPPSVICMEPPKGLIRFRELQLSQPYKRQLRLIFVVSSIITLLGVGVIITTKMNFVFIGLTILICSLIILVFAPELFSVVRTPLAVNMNHPFFDDEPMGKASVFIQLSNNEWQELGQYRVRLVNDEIVGGFNLVEDNEDYKLIGHFSNSKRQDRLAKQVIIINQALSLRDGINNESDPIENAREREKMDYGLLERDWLDEEEIEVEGPLAKLIRKD